MDEKICFVIQPFDEAKYDKRYRDIFEPAIRDAGVEPYRVDGDPNADVIISAIEEGIEKSDLCFAEITSNNPNVWYELGYARSCGKHVTMACEKNRKLPFDIQHRRIIQYEPASTSDFENLKKEITTSIRAALNKEASIKKITDPVSSNYKMPPHILTALVIVVSNENFGDGVAYDQIKKEMNLAGFNDLATNLAVRQLHTDGFLKREDRYDGEYVFSVIILTDKALKWISENQDDLDLNLTLSNTTNTNDDVMPPPYAADDDLPF